MLISEPLSEIYQAELPVYVPHFGETAPSLLARYHAPFYVNNGMVLVSISIEFFSI
jgi:hypothetical protein